MKIFIMGTGHIGSWLVEELCHDHEVAIFDTDPRKMKFFFNVERFVKLDEVKKFNPDMVINTVTLQYTVQSFKDVLPFISKKCILADTASVKDDLENFYKESKREFVSTHPMFGPTFANIRDLREENAIIIEESCETGKKFFADLYDSLKVKIFYNTFTEHDRTIAYSLSTPFASSMVFAACMEMQDAPGTTFRKHMETAKGLLSEDDTLLTEIMFNKYTIDQLRKINSQLTYLTHIIDAKDREEMAKFLKNLRNNIFS
jgi:prephenate dehydrogenase